MCDNREFVRSWHAWIRLERPVQAYHAGNRGAPGYDIECEVDHLVSWIYAAGGAYRDRAALDHVRRAESLLEDVDELRMRIIGGDLGAEQRQRYIGFLDASRHLLTILSECAAPHTSATADPEADAR